MYRRFLLCGLMLAALTQLSGGLWILAKAELAQWLIARAWRAEEAVKPWPWADTWPIARLRAPEQGVELFVLAGAQGNSLAFGPGWLPDSVYPGEQGMLVIAGHRDTHFRFLEHLPPGSLLVLEAANGSVRQYIVEAGRIVDSRRTPLWLTGDALVLVTCYPFDAVDPGGPLRYLVTARPTLTSV